MREHHKLFREQILNDTKEIFDLIFGLLSHPNREVKELASDTFEAIVTELSNGLKDNTLQKDTFSYLMKIFQGILDSLTKPTQEGAKKDVPEVSNQVLLITVCIRAIGLFSKAIQVFMGENQLKKLFNKFVEISETKIIR